MDSKEYQPSGGDLKTAGARAKKIFAILKKEYPEAKCALDHEDPLQLMISTILAARRWRPRRFHEEFKSVS